MPFSGVCGISRQELENADRPPEETETSTAKVKRFLIRLQKALPEWTMTAAELSMRPENLEDLTPRSIGYCLERAAQEAEIPLHRIQDRPVKVFSVNFRQTNVTEFLNISKQASEQVP